jgi:Zn-dependent M28 family amino/carboxypeptidase
MLMPEPNRKHPSNEERRNRIPGSALRQSRIPSQTLEDSELKIPLVSLSEAAGKELVASTGRPAPDIHTAIDRDLKPQSVALPGATARVEIVNADTRSAVSHNVVGILEGTDPTLRNETILITAHFDHDGPAANVGAMFPGADDNGSGTVGVVALAHAFVKSGLRLKRSIMFAVFAAEERGLLGSYYYAAHPLRPIEGTRAVINFDMIGRDEQQSTQTQGLIEIDADTSNELNLVGAYYSPDYARTVENANRKTGLKLNYKWDSEAALNVFFRSDQYPFVLRGIPAMWWFTGFHPDYHQVTDTVEKINFPKMVKILKLAYHSAIDFANAAKPPAFVAIAKPK